MAVQSPSANGVLPSRGREPELGLGGDDAIVNPSLRVPQRCRLRTVDGQACVPAVLARASRRRELEIRDCGAGDIEALERHMPTWDGQVHANLFAQQEAGLWTYLVAWKEGSAPVGVCVIRWDGSAEEKPEPSAEWPQVTNLQVHPAHRGRGVGSALIEATEERARGRRLSRLGISVADDNPRRRGSTNGWDMPTPAYDTSRGTCTPMTPGP